MRDEEYMRCQEQWDKEERERTRGYQGWEDQWAQEQKVKKEAYEEQRRARRAARQQESDRERAAQKEEMKRNAEKDSVSQLPEVLAKILHTEIKLGKLEAMMPESGSTPKDANSGNVDDEEIFHRSIKLNSLKKDLRKLLREHERIVKLLNINGKVLEADEAELRLRRKRAKVAKVYRASFQDKQQEEPAHPKKAAAAEKQTKSSKNPASRPRSRAPSSDASKRKGQWHQKVGDQQQESWGQPEHESNEGADPELLAKDFHVLPDEEVNFDDSDPDRGCTVSSYDGYHMPGEHEPDPATATLLDFHSHHMDAHKDFWDIEPDWQDCCFCGTSSTVMRCPECELLACSYCKSSRG